MTESVWAAAGAGISRSASKVVIAGHHFPHLASSFPCRHDAPDIASLGHKAQRTEHPDGCVAPWRALIDATDVGEHQKQAIVLGPLFESFTRRHVREGDQCGRQHHWVYGVSGTGLNRTDFGARLTLSAMSARPGPLSSCALRSSPKRPEVARPRQQVYTRLAISAGTKSKTLN